MPTLKKPIKGGVSPGAIAELERRAAAGDKTAAATLKTAKKAQQKTLLRQGFTVTGESREKQQKTTSDASSRQEGRIQRFTDPDFRNIAGVENNIRSNVQEPSPDVQPGKMSDLERKINALDKRYRESTSPEEKARFKELRTQARQQLNEQKKNNIRATTDIATSKVEKARNDAENIVREEGEDELSFLRRQLAAFQNLFNVESDGFENIATEKQEAATDFGAGVADFTLIPELEDIPTVAEIEDEFFSSRQGERQEEEAKLLEDRQALEKEILEFEQQKAAKRREEFIQRSAESADALTGNPATFGAGANLSLSLGIQRKGIEALEEAEKADRLELRQLIQNQDQIKFVLDDKQRAEVDSYINNRITQVTESNAQVVQQYKDARDFELEQQKSQIELLKFFDTQKLNQLKTLELTGNIMKQQEDTALRKFNLPFDLFDKAKKTTGINEASTAFITDFLSQQGIDIDPAMFETTDSFETLVGLAEKMAGLPGPVAGALLEQKGNELSAEERAVLKAVEESAGQLSPKDLLELQSLGLKIQGQQLGLQQGFFNLEKSEIEFDQELLESGNVEAVASRATDGSRSKAPWLKGTLTGVEGGSGIWSFGLDVGLDGGKGAGVPAGISGKVVGVQSSAESGGFGNRVLIQDSDGRVMSIGHLQNVNAQVGQDVNFNTVIGTQGNSGKTIYGYDADGKPLEQVDGNIKPNRGIHVDYTMYPDATRQNPLSSREVYAEMLRQGQGEKKPVFEGKDKFDAERSLRNDFESKVKDQKGAIRQLNIMEQSLSRAERQQESGESLNAVSQGILVTFQKILDPTSVVRESEYARSGDGQSLFQSLAGKIEKLQKGGAGVTIEELRDFTFTAQEFLEGYKKSLVDQAKLTRRVADDSGLDINNVLTGEVLQLLDQFDTKDETEEVGVFLDQFNFDEVDNFLLSFN